MLQKLLSELIYRTLHLTSPVGNSHGLDSNFNLLALIKSKTVSKTIFAKPIIEFQLTGTI